MPIPDFKDTIKGINEYFRYSCWQKFIYYISKMILPYPLGNYVTKIMRKKIAMKVKKIIERINKKDPDVKLRMS